MVVNGSKGVKLCGPEIHGWCSCIKLYDSIDLKWTKGQKLVRYYLIIHILSLSTFILSQITVQSNSKISKSAQTTSTIDVYRPNWPLWPFNQHFWCKWSFVSAQDRFLTRPSDATIHLKTVHFWNIFIFTFHDISL